MTAVLDRVDQLPVLVWALIVMVTCWLVIGTGALVEWVVITALRSIA
jgi:hypothetical protein